MPFKSPMLASPLSPKFTLLPGEFLAEEKVDGHRLVVEVKSGKSDLFTDGCVTAWSRNGLIRVLPSHLVAHLSLLVPGFYDGELLVPGKRSYGVTEIANSADLEFHVFDILEVEGDSVCHEPLRVRKQLLGGIFARYNMDTVNQPWQYVRLLPSTPVDTWDQVFAMRDDVWSSDGEGLILKRMDAPYLIGKRSKDLIKIKALRSATLVVTGFLPSKGQIMNRGPYAMIVLADEDGNTTTVKTRNDAECRKLEQEAIPGQPHPAIGRRLVIDYQERTPDGSYRHPRFDHWE